MTSLFPLRREQAQASHASHLFLAIDETLYAIDRMGAHPGSDSRVFRLKKADGRFYDVAETPHGPECDCPDFLFRRKGIDPAGCKHIQALVRHALIEKQDDNLPQAARRAGVQRRSAVVDPCGGLT
ncbi:MAG TPA: hypothetical protein VGZ22_21425 [Isosphaeraceae bacterium]|jgi:hypothetical protein|nr:hypothetical protein [Isosphaeraceae bacterium]